MSLSEESNTPATGGVLTKLFAAVGGLATVACAGLIGLTMTSEGARECAARGYPTIVCAAGAAKLVDLAALLERDKKVETLTAQTATLEGDLATLKGRLTEAEGRAKELDSVTAAARTANTEVERLRGETAKRDAKIAELNDKLSAAMKRLETPPVPTARPAPPATPAPATAPRPLKPQP